jgi:hypothetical protein
MKKYAATLSLIAAASLSATSAFATEACAVSGWDVEFHSFYGAKTAMVKKLANLPVKLSDRRVFIQVTQGDSSAGVRLYEQQKDGTFTVTEWAPSETARLLVDIDKAIMANKAVNCCGEQVKAVLTKELKEGKVSKGVSAPASPEAAFAHPVKEATGQFIKTTIVILC